MRAASPADAPALAQLIDLAGEGLPRWLWSRAAEAGEDPFEVGRRRAAREDGGFSYRNAHVVEAGGRVIGMVLGYPLPDPYPEEDRSRVPEPIRPLLELERMAPGTWYVNAVAVDAEARGRGWGTQLMQRAETLARQRGSTALSLIVAEENRDARGLYERLGFETRGRRPIVPIPGLERGGDWLLMIKPIS